MPEPPLVTSPGGAVFDELPQPWGETAGVDQMDEVAVAGPLLELNVRHPSEALSIAVGQRPPEYGQAGDLEA